ncbi:hypothetical protein NQ314_008115 [Rhamnusium bicolor]|uniref:Uncharacterized protein n=1 Tax=Rhamnusium bicolor TaxID=1586634 RepID=A0AAV8YGR1_9CUCU|nr:hypothetical protein NQ314_008115 [Rhamnusium bicolor]
MRFACGENCRLKCSTKFSEDERLHIFQQFWLLGDIHGRGSLLQQMATINPKYRYPKTTEGCRNNNKAFYFQKKKNNNIRVCKNFLKATLDITDRNIRTIVSKNNDGFLNADLRGKHEKHKTVSEAIKNGVRNHISSIPRIESHYLRAQTEKQYIEGGKTIAQLHRDYKIECEEHGKPCATLTMYTRIFNYEFNLAIFVPKKDQCERCGAYDNSNNEENEKLQLE